MKTLIQHPRRLSGVPIDPGVLGIVLAVMLGAASALGAAGFSAWQQRADLAVPEPGLMEVSLAPAVLDAARPGFEDLRLVDPQGVELPFLVQRLVPEPAVFRAVRTFRATLQPNTTTLELETGQAVPVDAVRLETPERGFLKAVRLEGSADGRQYQLVGEGIPLFVQAGVSELTVRFPPERWAWLRLTLDDERSAPVVFTGAKVQTAGAATPLIPVETVVRSIEPSGHDTRIALNLGAANLFVAEIELATPDTWFQREVVVHALSMVEDGLRETEIGRGLIYSVDLGTGDPARRQTIVLARQVLSRELILLIRNLDSPPLTVSGVLVRRRPVQLTFQARESGRHQLFVGNAQCPAPRYDLAGLGGQLSGVARRQLTPGILEDNPAYRAPEILPGLGDVAALLDTGPWRFRRSVEITTPGPQQLELDLEVLSRARSDLGDLRLARADHQVPYLIERTSITRPVTPGVVLAPEPKRPSLSRWKLELSGTNQPLTRLEGYADNPLFRRQVRLWEEVADGRGGKRVRELGRADWQRTPESSPSVFALDLVASPLSDTLFLETDNGDNPMLELGGFRMFHPVTRLVFKATEPLDLYYGHPTARMPRYDLALVARQLLSADRMTAVLGLTEMLKAPGWTEGEVLTGLRAWIFWGILALVVLGLLVIMARLLPKPKETEDPSK